VQCAPNLALFSGGGSSSPLPKKELLCFKGACPRPPRLFQGVCPRPPRPRSKAARAHPQGAEGSRGKAACAHPTGARASHTRLRWGRAPRALRARSAPLDRTRRLGNGGGGGEPLRSGGCADRLNTAELSPGLADPSIPAKPARRGPPPPPPARSVGQRSKSGARSQVESAFAPRLERTQLGPVSPGRRGEHAGLVCVRGRVARRHHARGVAIRIALPRRCVPRRSEPIGQGGAIRVGTPPTGVWIRDHRPRGQPRRVWPEATGSPAKPKRMTARAKRAQGWVVRDH